MELWIRSQNKEYLIKIYNISIGKNNEILGNLVSDDNKSICDYWVLGTYKTKERALEIIDEIQNLLNPMLVFKNCNCTQEMLDNIKEAGACVVSDNAHIEQIQTCIYEMPKE